MKADVMVPVADNAVHPELAQANLMRLRGDLDGAEKMCLSILKRFPNEPEAHILLGELSADRGDWRRAAEWYELAVDLNPSSTADKARLEEAKQRIEASETAETVEQLGLPDQTPKIPWVAGSVVLILVLVIIGAIVSSRSAGRSQPPPISTVVNASPDEDNNQGVTKTSGTAEDGTTKSGADETTDAANMPLDDRTLLSLLQARSEEGKNVSTVVGDPRFHMVTVTYTVPSGVDPRKIGATLAKDTLDQSPDANIVTVRGLSNDQLVYTADATRSKLNDVEASAAQSSAGSDPDAWIGVLMQHEWTPKSDAQATTSGGTQETSASGTPATSTSGGTTSGSDSPASSTSPSTSPGPKTGS